MCLEKASVKTSRYTLCAECACYRRKYYEIYKDYSRFTFFAREPVNMIANQLCYRYKYNMIFTLAHCNGHEQYEEQLHQMCEDHYVGKKIKFDPSINIFAIMMKEREKNIHKMCSIENYTSEDIEGLDIKRPNTHIRSSYKRPSTNVFPTKYKHEEHDESLLCINCQKRRIVYIKKLYSQFLTAYPDEEYCPIYNAATTPYDFERRYFSDPYDGFYNETTKATLAMPEHLDLFLLKSHEQTIYLDNNEEK